MIMVEEGEKEKKKEGGRVYISTSVVLACFSITSTTRQFETSIYVFDSPRKHSTSADDGRRVSYHLSTRIDLGPKKTKTSAKRYWLRDDLEGRAHADADCYAQMVQ